MKQPKIDKSDWRLRRLAASVLPAWLTSALLTVVAYAQSVDFMPIQAIGQPLAFASAVAVGVWLAMLALLRTPAAAAVAAVLFLFFNALCAPLMRCVPDLGLWPTDACRLSPAFLVVSLAGAGLIALTGLIGRRRPAWLARALSPLTLFLAANLLFAIGRTVVLECLRPRDLALFQPLALPDPPAAGQVPQPTVLHLVLDGYARADILQSRYGYDQAPFIANLQSLGFHVVPRARSNYPQTALSLASLLNLDYIEPTGMTVSNLFDRTPLLQWIQNSRVVDAFRRSGYEIVNFPSGYDFTDKIGADRCVAPRRFNELSAHEWARSWLGTLIDGCDAETAQHVKRIETLFQRLPAELAASARPRYIFAHVICPHPPFVFDAKGLRARPARFDLFDGSHRVGPHYSAAQYRDDYLAQLRYVSMRIEGLMKQILETPSRPLVILLHADHGPGAGLQWESRATSDVDERSAIFCALYFPDGNYADIADDLTLVNLFRVVFNRYLGAAWPLLPNRAFFARWSHPYQFELLDRAAPR